jgi:hypothetical protein
MRCCHRLLRLFGLRSFFSWALSRWELKIEAWIEGREERVKIRDLQKLQSCESAHFTRKESTQELWRSRVWLSTLEGRRSNSTR